MKPKANQSTASKTATSATKQTAAYWKVRNAWAKPSKSANRQMTFGEALSELHKIINRPATPHLANLASALLNDIVLNSADSPSPRAAPRITGKTKK